MVFVNAKQYKGILRRRQIRKLRQTPKKKISMVLPKVNNISSKASQTSVGKREAIKGIKSSLIRIEGFVANKEDKKSNKHDNKSLYSPTSTPLMWSSGLYVEELMSINRRLELLEAKKWYEGKKSK